MSSPPAKEIQTSGAAGDDAGEVPGISHAQFDGYEKPKTPLPTILEELIQTSPFGQLDVQEIYIELRARYPYFRVHAEPQVWQNRVRNCLSTSSQFKKVAKPCAKRASFWTVVPKSQRSPPAKKRRRVDSGAHYQPSILLAPLPIKAAPSSPVASANECTPSHSQSQSQDDSSTIMSVADFLARSAPSPKDELSRESPVSWPTHRDSSLALQTQLSSPAATNDELHSSSSTTAVSCGAPTARQGRLATQSYISDDDATPVSVTYKVVGLTSQLSSEMFEADRAHNLGEMRAAYRRYCAEVESLLFTKTPEDTTS